ncbi:hypothetical protein L228DRAFT_284785 [Xylona heveae TC161]|uniref:Wbp11/ELF5/Saf1 N-terminal domain-containing protein n=1 Tax=Xylona heveae (strain CBS 132557 / TC161) TaxID=1328760 RepID=A0A165FE25_XYLHT|nr:hypothetical protein L228DRAFT_284785 [Xylona heveae TC161]KZF20870.1 hypothetical protein L228DRAFT_284785 [Xylona heveae TC161]
MVKERSVNPAQAQRKLEKQKALKKSKAEQQTRRNEKLARRNPGRMQRQIDELKAAEESRPLSTRDKSVLEELERDLRAVLKAREALGDKAPQFSSSHHHDGGGGGGGTGRGGHGQRGGRGGGSYLGKRRRGSDDGDSSDSEETDEEVRRIPMPRDSPPPIPPRRRHNKNANMIPLGGGAGEGGGRGERVPHALPQKPQVQAPAQTVYESKPVVRDLRKEAISAFVPAAVQRKLGLQKGEGGRLLEPEEADRLEREGYGQKEAETSSTSASPLPPSAVSAQLGPGGATSEDEIARLQAEQERFERELRTVQVEEVEDEDL